MNDFILVIIFIIIVIVFTFTMLKFRDLVHLVGITLFPHDNNNKKED